MFYWRILKGYRYLYRFCAGFLLLTRWMDISWVLKVFAEVFPLCTIRWNHLHGTWYAWLSNDGRIWLLWVGEDAEYIGGEVNFFHTFKWIHEDYGFILFFSFSLILHSLNSKADNLVHSVRNFLYDICYVIVNSSPPVWIFEPF